ncbi:MAG: alpha/beta hydrolase [Clostridia bacterium]|nr:alpha/beta hydrolase [Clostridia bacterium]
MAIPIEMIQTDNMCMRFFRFGSGAKALVILPGLSVKSVMKSAVAIANQYAVFEEEYTSFIFERREVLPQAYSIEDMAEDTAAAIQALGLQEVCLFGASQGGMIAMLLAAKHPELVKKMILGSTAARVSAAGFATIEEWIAFAEQKDAAGLYESFCKKIYPTAFYEKYRSLFLATSETVTEEELARFITLAKTIEGFDCTKELADIRCPVLVIGSEDDAVLGSAPTIAIYNALRSGTQAQYYLYSDKGHDAYDTAPDYQQRMFEFFES